METKKFCLTKRPDRAAWPGPSSGDTPYLGPVVLRGCQSQGTPSCPSSSIPTTAVTGLWMSQIRPIRVLLGLFWYTQVGNTSFRFEGGVTVQSGRSRTHLSCLGRTGLSIMGIKRMIKEKEESLRKCFRESSDGSYRSLGF